MQQPVTGSAKCTLYMTIKAKEVTQVLLNHIWGLFTMPQQEWQLIRSESSSVSKVYLTHVLLLAAIPAICGYIGFTQVGWSVGNDKLVKLTESNAAGMALLSYCAMLAGIFVMGCFIQWMAKTYNASTSLSQTIVFAAYTATPLFFTGLGALLPNVWLNMLLAIAGASYATYLLYTGIPVMMQVPKEVGFLFASSVLCVGLVVLVSIITITVLVWGIGIGPSQVVF
ncbi:Yip1 family protein [Spartinivicinus ruber]|uniref:Yip1 family protein n=1 Tax=Spartinivicinus ruber TaxID=2683272 RepID=UPI001E586203|nr:Yip1 family protein [Spartinivicinus ruber]